jgi:large subunit ribosomal protein L10
MLNRSDKEAIVDGLKADIDKAKAVFLTNLIGISSNDSVAIRKSVRDVNGKVIVTRNTLFSRAAMGTSCEKLFSNLKGPQAVAFAFEDPAAVAKCLKEAGKELELVELRGGVLEGKELSKAEVLELANLPSRDEMLGTLLATFMAPVSAFARVTHAIGEKKGETSEEATTETDA